MGKYMKKSKITGDVGVMEVFQPSSLGFRTRAAKTLALQRLNSSGALLAPVASAAQDSGSSCYLQLRNRRLEKPLLLADSKKQQKQETQKSEGGEVGRSCRARSGSRLRMGSVNPGTGSVAVSRSCEGEGWFNNNGISVGADANCENKGFCETEEGNDVDVEASFGENNLEFETRERSTRQSTPCNFIRDPDTIVTPGSTSRRIRSSYQRGRDNILRIVPTTLELQEFFACAEEQQQKLFTEKYNFDIVNDRPLPGRYEWVQVAP